MAEIYIYSGPSCPYCENAKALLKSKGAEFQEITVTNDPEKFQSTMQKYNARTVPQIFINDQHIGGFDQLRALDLSGDLDKLLEN